jgi:hypothetical protein
MERPRGRLRKNRARSQDDMRISNEPAPRNARERVQKMPHRRLCVKIPPSPEKHTQRSKGNRASNVCAVIRPYG